MPSLVGAALYGATGNGLLLYNALSLFFWALSGICLYAFLKEFGWHELACVFGATAFCLLPYRTSYYLEFNMQLIFGVPLSLLFLLRLIKKPRLGPAIGLALSLAAQAVSALY